VSVQYCIAIALRELATTFAGSAEATWNGLTFRLGDVFATIAPVALSLRHQTPMGHGSVTVST